MPNENKFIVRSKERVLSILGIHSDTDKSNTNSVIEKIQSGGSFSPSELTALKSMNKGNVKRTSPEEMRSNLKNVSANVATKIAENRAFQDMVPEITKSKRVIGPSVMNPVDLYGEDVLFSLDCPKLSDETRTAIELLLTTVFNKTLQLGSKMSEWIGEALFDNGATPVMLLPRKTLSMLTSDKDGDTIVSTESKGIKPSAFCDIEISQEDIWKDVGNDIFNIYPDEAITIGNNELFSSIESILPIPNVEAKVPEHGLDKSNTEYASVLKCEIAENLKLNMSISLDHRLLITPDEQIKIAEESMHSRFNNITKKPKEKVEDLDSNITNAGNMNILSITDSDINSDGEPIIYKLPTASTIPVHVPGSPSAHLGYFVVIDENGNPITGNESKGTEIVPNGPFVTSFDKLLGKAKGTEQDKADALSVAFDLMLKKTIKGSMKKMDVKSADIPEVNGVYSCIFHNLMRNNKVKLIYVPTSMMGYYAYDYRPDGTGKGIMEDSSFLIGLRTSLMVAKVIGALDNATDKHRITFDMDESLGTNMEQVMEIIQDAYLEKHMYSFDHNPMSVMRNIVSRNISIMPKNMTGFANLEIERDVSQGQAGNIDDDMEDKLTNLITTPTNIPAAVFNELGENEFSRSVATTNIIFSNFIRVLQRETCIPTRILVQAYVRNSFNIVKDIKSILSKHVKEGNQKSFDNYLEYIIKGIVVSLPQPNISPDKARYEELSTIMTTIDEVVEKLLPEELIVEDEEGKTKETLIAVRADVSRRMVKDAISQIGATSMLNIATSDDIKFKEVQDINWVMRNYARGLSDLSEHLKKKASDNTEDAW